MKYSGLTKSATFDLRGGGVGKEKGEVAAKEINDLQTFWHEKCNAAFQKLGDLTSWGK